MKAGSPWAFLSSARQLTGMKFELVWRPSKRRSPLACCDGTSGNNSCHWFSESPPIWVFRGDRQRWLGRHFLKCRHCKGCNFYGLRDSDYWCRNCPGRLLGIRLTTSSTQRPLSMMHHRSRCHPWCLETEFNLSAPRLEPMCHMSVSPCSR